MGLVACGPLLSCKKERQEVTREELSEAGYGLDREDYFRAAQSDDLKALKRMLSGGIALDARDSTGRSALHAAAGAGAMGSIDFLLDQGMEVDVIDDMGRTPMMEAALRSTPETLRYLLRQGADPSIKDKDKYKPMMLVVKEGRHEMVAELALYVREDLDDALLVAAIMGQAKVIDELTNFGASIYARLEDGRTPLMLAAQNGQREAVEMLLAIGANRFAMDSEGRMATDLAKLGDHEDLALRLADDPEEGDFELSDPAELGVEMVSMVEQAGGENRSRSGVEVGEDLPVNEELASAGAWSIPEDEGLPMSSLSQRPQGGVDSLEGATLEMRVQRPAKNATDTAAGNEVLVPNRPPVVMRSYREKELPMRVESVKDDSVTIRLAGGEKVEVAEGKTIPGSSLKVIRVERKMLSGKENQGDPVEVSVVEVSDPRTGEKRELITGLPALAHDPLALVEDSASGRYYLARTGQKFSSVDGDEYRVTDVRPNQVIIENLKTRETTTISLRGPQG